MAVSDMPFERKLAAVCEIVPHVVSDTSFVVCVAFMFPLLFHLFHLFRFFQPVGPAVLRGFFLISRSPRSEIFSAFDYRQFLNSYAFHDDLPP
jgi:hypothetical protein